MQRVNVAIGETRIGLVTFVAKKNEAQGIIVRGDDGGAYILLGHGHAIEPREGDRVTMRFAEGGPNRGYWKITAKEANSGT